MKESECFTINEIKQQPGVWMKTYKLMLEQKNKIQKFLKEKGFSKDSEIILTGAGSSAFIADTAVCFFVHDGYKNARSIPTTDIVSCPEYFLQKGSKIVFSFGRSGNSPESVAAYNIINKVCHKTTHIIITCNADGYLARNANPENDYVLVLPEETNDKSLAMTSSFSTMLLAGLMIKNIDEIESLEAKIDAASKFAFYFLSESILSKISKITDKKISRAVFLGSGPLTGIARECHLKLQELTDGDIMCAYDSFMGLRHGPKAIIDNNTLVVYLLLDEKYTNQYEIDLIKQINKEHSPAAQISVSENELKCSDKMDISIISQFNHIKDNEFEYIPYVLVGQLLGFYFSLAKGLNPDNPSISGTISRVVNGVKIYNY